MGLASGKTALEYYWRIGSFSISGRENFQKIYDLTERVIPQSAREEMPDEAGFIDWAAQSALDRLGQATSGEIAAFWDLISPKEAAAWCKHALARGDLMEVMVEDVAGEKPRKAFARPDLAESLLKLPQVPARIRVLSPFDPLIRDRKRLERLFGFDYRIEVFVPAAKRKYGYYVFPLLEGDRFIGRIDMKHHKDQGGLKVTGLWLEPGIRYGSGREAARMAELERQRRFVGAERLEFAEGYQKA